MKRAGSKGMFVSFKFGSKSTTPSDARPERCFDRLPRLCTGVLLFDILVANSDRWVKNIKVDDPDSPTEIDIFDHERALFGEFAGDGRKRLSDLFDRLGVTGGRVTGGNRHCFISVVNTVEHFWYWTERISVIPDLFIQDVCAEAPSVTQDEQSAAANFLKYRKRNLAQIITAHKDQFAEIVDWGLYS